MVNVVYGSLRRTFQFLFPTSIKRGHTELKCPSSTSLNIDLQYTTKIRDPTQLENLAGARF